MDSSAVRIPSLTRVLLRNANQQFIGKNIYMKSDNGPALKIPIALGKAGIMPAIKYWTTCSPTDSALKYCDADGNIPPEANRMAAPGVLRAFAIRE
jgi:hypothetical protein